jgi:hypothetical protein
MLEAQRNRAWNDIVALDGSGLHLNRDYEFGWQRPYEIVREQEEHKSQSKNSYSGSHEIGTGFI